MRRLGGLLSAILVGSMLLALSVLLTLQMIEDGDNLVGISLGIAGIAASVAAMAWIGILEGIFAGLDTKKISQALIILGAASPIMGASSFAAGGRVGQAFLVAGVLALGWCASRLIGALKGPPAPEHLPRELAHEYRGPFKAPRLAGTIGGHPVTVEYSNAWNGERFESRRVDAFLPDGGRELTMVPATFIGRMSGSIEKTGDGAFDEQVHVRGLRLLVLTLLRAPARAAVRELVRAGGTFEDGAARSDARVPLPVLVKAASAVSVTGSIFETLSTNAFADPDAGVRLSTIEFLLTLGASEAREAALAACRKALDDADPRLQVLGIAVVLASGAEPAMSIARDRLGASVRAGAVIGELLDRQDGGAASLALLALLEDPRTGADAAPAVERLARRTKDEATRARAEAILESLRRRVEEGRGQVSLSAPDTGAGAVSLPDEAGRLSHAKKEPAS